MAKTLLGKKIVFVIAFRNFQDLEYFVTREILEEEGAEIFVASNQKGTAVGFQGGEAEVDYLINDLKVSGFDVVVFIGGQGCLQNLDNHNSYRICQEAVDKEKILASICISPVILAKAGVLTRKKSTVWSSPLDKSAIKMIEKFGAIYQIGPVVINEKIITADGPEAAKQFAKAIIQVLTER